MSLDIINIKDIDGITALEDARRKEKKNVVKLIEHFKLGKEIKSSSNISSPGTSNTSTEQNTEFHDEDLALEEVIKQEFESESIESEYFESGFESGFEYGLRGCCFGACRTRPNTKPLVQAQLTLAQKQTFETCVLQGGVAVGWSAGRGERGHWDRNRSKLHSILLNLGIIENHSWNRSRSLYMHPRFVDIS